MNVRVHIERLVADEGVLAPGDGARFRVALVAELGYLRTAAIELRDPPRDAMHTLARNVAFAIHDRMPRS